MLLKINKCLEICSVFSGENILTRVEHENEKLKQNFSFLKQKYVQLS